MTYLAFSGLLENSSMRQQRSATEVSSDIPRWLVLRGSLGMILVMAFTPSVALFLWSVDRLRSVVAAARTTASCPLFNRSARRWSPLEVRMMLRIYTDHCKGIRMR